MKKNSILVRIAASLLCLLMTAGVLSGCEGGLFSGMTIDNPKTAITEFIDAMQSPVFDDTAAETAMSYVANYSTMGFEKYAQVQDDRLEKRLFDLLRQSYSVEFFDSSSEDISNPYQSSDMTVSGKKAYVRIKFSCVDYTLMSEALSEKVTEIASERAFYGETFETEEQAMALVDEVFDTVFVPGESMDRFCVERELTLEMKYVDSSWKIVISDEFYDALLGK